MNFTEISKKILALCALFVLLVNISFLASPKKAEADMPVIDPANLGSSVAQLGEWVWSNGKVIANAVLASAERYAVRLLIQQITQDTVSWINNGFNGNPAYVSDPGEFLSNIGNQVVGDFIMNNPDLNFLCSPFQTQVKLALNLTAASTFRNQIGCTLTGAIANSQNAAASFINSAQNGGWTNWIQLTSQPQNTAMGAYLMAQAQVNSQVAAKQSSAQQDLAQGQGSLSFQSCTTAQYDSNGNMIPGSQSAPVLGSPYLSKGSVGNSNSNTSSDPTVQADQQQILQYTNDLKSDRPGSQTAALDQKNLAAAQVKLQSDTSAVQQAQQAAAAQGAGMGAGSAGASAGAGEPKQTCQTETPGAVISGMLLSKTTQSDQINNLQAALGDGLDQIFSALANQLLTRLKNGVLGDNSAVDAQNTAQVQAAARTAALQAQSDQQQVNSTLSGVTDANGNPINLSNLDQLPDTSSYDSLLGNFNQSTSASTPSNISNDPLIVPRTSALDRIISAEDGETNYQNTYVTAMTILNSADAIFASSTACNYAQNNATAILRGQQITANVTTNIEGSSNGSRSTPSITWNLPAIQNLLDISNANSDLLNTAQSAVNSASSYDAIQTAMTPINSHTFNVDPQRNVLTQIDFWLTQMAANYSTAACPINIASTTAIEAPDIVSSVLPVVPSSETGTPTIFVPTTSTSTNSAWGPSISSINPTTFKIGDAVTIEGSQLLYSTSTSSGNENTILLDGNPILNNVSGNTIQGLALTFTMPSSAVDGTAIIAGGSHTLSDETQYGTSNSLSITLSPSWVHCAAEGSTCTFSGTRTVRYGKGSNYHSGTYTGSVSCNDTVFGDLNNGSGNSCDYWSGNPTISGGYSQLTLSSVHSSTSNNTVTITLNGSGFLSSNDVSVQTSGETCNDGHTYPNSTTGTVAKNVTSANGTSLSFTMSYRDYSYDTGSYEGCQNFEVQRNSQISVTNTNGTSNRLLLQ